MNSFVFPRNQQHIQSYKIRFHWYSHHPLSNVSMNWVEYVESHLESVRSVRTIRWADAWSSFGQTLLASPIVRPSSVWVDTTLWHFDWVTFFRSEFLEELKVELCSESSWVLQIAIKRSSVGVEVPSKGLLQRRSSSSFDLQLLIVESFTSVTYIV